MLKNVLFRGMNVSMMGISCDLGFCRKDGGHRKIVPQGP